MVRRPVSRGAWTARACPGWGSDTRPDQRTEHVFACIVLWVTRACRVTLASRVTVTLASRERPSGDPRWNGGRPGRPGRRTRVGSQSNGSARVYPRPDRSHASAGGLRVHPQQAAALKLVDTALESEFKDPCVMCALHFGLHVLDDGGHCLQVDDGSVEQRCWRGPIPRRRGQLDERAGASDGKGMSQLGRVVAGRVQQPVVVRERAPKCVQSVPFVGGAVGPLLQRQAEPIALPSLEAMPPYGRANLVEKAEVADGTEPRALSVFVANGARLRVASGRLPGITEGPPRMWTRRRASRRARAVVGRGRALRAL